MEALDLEEQSSTFSHLKKRNLKVIGLISLVQIRFLKK